MAAGALVLVAAGLLLFALPRETWRPPAVAGAGEEPTPRGVPAATGEAPAPAVWIIASPATGGYAWRRARCARTTSWRSRTRTRRAARTSRSSASTSTDTSTGTTPPGRVRAPPPARRRGRRGTRATRAAGGDPPRDGRAAAGDLRAVRRSAGRRQGRSRPRFGAAGPAGGCAGGAAGGGRRTVERALGRVAMSGPRRRRGCKPRSPLGRRWAGAALAACWRAGRGRAAAERRSRAGARRVRADRRRQREPRRAELGAAALRGRRRRPYLELFRALGARTYVLVRAWTTTRAGCTRRRRPRRCRRAAPSSRGDARRWRATSPRRVRAACGRRLRDLRRPRRRRARRAGPDAGGRPRSARSTLLRDVVDRAAADGERT